MVEPRRVDGVDLSHWNQQDINWEQAKKAGLKWMYHKATEGNTVEDAWYPRRRRQARAAGVPFGAYHFARPERGDAEKEAEHFLKVARPRPLDLAPALDLEVQGDLNLEELKHWVWRWLNVVERAIDMPAVLYTPYDLGEHIHGGHVLWRPRYNNTNTPPKLAWDIWQFSNGAFGVPRSMPGIGNVDLNTHAKGFQWRKEMLIPLPKVRLRFAHLSMQFSDTDKQKEQDVAKLFGRGYDILTGTESGGKPLPNLLRVAAHNQGYVFHLGSGDWVAVRRDLIKGKAQVGYEKVIDASEGTGPHADRGITWIKFNTANIGEVTMGVGHWLTNGRKPGDPNYRLNERMADAVGKWGREHGKGKALCFYAADFNRVDRLGDVFSGNPFITAADALKKYKNTGHGNIDGHAVYSRDSRVEWVKLRVLSDKQVHFHTDHYLVESVAEVQTLP